MSLEVPGFRHLHAGHCESGVTAAMFQNGGLNVSEALVFGVGSGIFFAHFSFVKVMGVPLTTFRSFPGEIFKKACRRLGVQFQRETFSSPEKGMKRLDQLLDQGQRVGAQVNIYWLPYIPRPMRIHFNGHNLLILERRAESYIVSDPVMECLFECPTEALARARFSGRNFMLPSGLLYYPTRLPSTPDIAKACADGIRESAHRMVHIPRIFPWMGVQGIGHLSRAVRVWPQSLPEERATEWLASLVRVQEEIGTGGAGFRYIFAAFLQTAAEALGRPQLQSLSEKATRVGDRWRTFALHASRRARGRADRSWEELSDMLQELSVEEELLFRELAGVELGGRRLLG